MKLCFVQFQWVIDDYDWHPEPIVDALADSFDAVAFSTTQTSEFKTAKLKAAIEYANDRGLYVYLWLRPGNMNWWHPDLLATWPVGWNLLDWVPNVPKCEQYDVSWPDFSRPETRYWIKERLVDEVKKYYASGLTGVLYDYMRYPAKAWIVPKQVVSADDVTKLVQQTSIAMRDLNLATLASPVDARIYDLPDGLPAGGTQPRYQIHGQDWPTWIRNGTLDLAYMMTYCGTSGLATQWAGVPESVRQQTVSLLNVGKAITSKQDIINAHRIVTEELGGLGVAAFISHGNFPSIAESGILSAFAELPAMPIILPEPQEPGPPEPEPPEISVSAIANELNVISARIEQLATMLESV